MITAGVCFASGYLQTGIGTAGSWPCHIADRPTRDEISSAIGVIRGELVNIRPGPRPSEFVLTLRTIETYKGPLYPAWEVLWRQGDTSYYTEGEIYLAPISRISPEFRGRVEYDFYGQFTSGNCRGRTHLYKWTQELATEVRSLLAQ